MLSRVVKPDTTTYTGDYTRKNVRKEVGKNLSTMLTTGVRYTDTPKALYQTDFTETAERHNYTRPRLFKIDMMQLPAEYQSTVRPKLVFICFVTEKLSKMGRFPV